MDWDQKVKILLYFLLFPLSTFISVAIVIVDSYLLSHCGCSEEF